MVKIVETGAGNEIAKGGIEAPRRIHFEEHAEPRLFHGVHDGGAFGGDSKVDEGGIGVESFPEFGIKPLLRGADGEERSGGWRDGGIGGVDYFDALVPIFGDPRC